MTPRFRLVFLDVDSTLVSIEGIDVLSGGSPEIAALTAAAMNGEVPLDAVYGRRLDIIRPTRADVDALGGRYIDALVPGAETTVRALHHAGVQVHLLTAGIAQAVAPVAAHLGIPARCIHAVRLELDGDAYSGFDKRSFLTRPGGKELVIRDIRARAHGNAAMVGDGVSDLEASPAVDLFIGFSGVVTRPLVRDAAAVFVTSWEEVRQNLIDD